jgi:hypothetical protein
MEFEFDDYPIRMIEAISSAEVVCVFFVRAGHSLILDLRTDDGEQPVVLIDEIQATPRDRLLSFSRLRPNLPLPDEITLAPWTGRVSEFRESGVLEAMIERCIRIGGERFGDIARMRFSELVTLERDIMRSMVRGIGMETIWQRDPNA